jgi:hypothetical protein
VEGLKVVLWLRGIKQWRSGSEVSSVAVAALLRSPLSRGGEEQRKGNGEREGGSEVPTWLSSMNTHM